MTADRIGSALVVAGILVAFLASLLGGIALAVAGLILAAYGRRAIATGRRQSEEELLRIDAMRERGLITDAEFEGRRAALKFQLAASATGADRICVNCGTAVAPGRDTYCQRCGKVWNVKQA